MRLQTGFVGGGGEKAFCRLVERAMTQAFWMMDGSFANQGALVGGEVLFVLEHEG